MTLKDDDHLLYDISRCLETGIPVPPRLSARFIDLVRKAYDGDFRSWDEAFGKPRLNPEKRRCSDRWYREGENPYRGLRLDLGQSVSGARNKDPSCAWRHDASYRTHRLDFCFWAFFETHHRHHPSR